MADAVVENPLNTVPPHKKQLPSSIPNFDTLEGFTTEGDAYEALLVAGIRER